MSDRVYHDENKEVLREILAEKLVVTEQYEGVLMDDVLPWLIGDELKSFTQFMAGQTGAIHEGKLLVYKWDLERWLAGLAVID